MSELQDLIAFISTSAFSQLSADVQEEIKNKKRTLMLQRKEELFSSIRNALVPLMKEYGEDVAICVNYDAQYDIVEVRDNIQVPPTADAGQKECGAESNEPIFETSSYKRGTMSVTMPDGTVIKEKTAIQTFVKVLRIIGLERVATEASEVTAVDWPIVCKNSRPYVNESFQKKVDGWYVYSNISNAVKKHCLEKISELLNYKLEIKFDGVSVDDEEKSTSTNSAEFKA